MGSAVRYEYMPEHPDSVAARAGCVPADVRRGQPAYTGPVGIFRFRDGAPLRITLEDDGALHAQRLGKPPAARGCCFSLLRRVLFLLRTALHLEGGQRWKLDASGAAQIRAALAKYQATAGASIPTPQCDAEEAEPASPAVVLRQPGAAARDCTPAFALALASIFPFLNGRDRISVMSVASAFFGMVNDAERTLARALARATTIRDSQAFILAVGTAQRWDRTGILDGPQQARLLSGLAECVGSLPADQRRDAVIRLTSRIAAVQRAGRCVRSALIALADVVRSTPDLRDAGPVIMDPICRIVAGLTLIDGIATGHGRVKVALALMRESWKTPAMARTAWRLLVPDDGNWLEAIAHLTLSDRMRVLPGVVAASMALGIKEERKELLVELNQRWHAMARCVLRLDADDPLKLPALAAVLAAWPFRGDGPRSAPRDGLIWDAAFVAVQNAQPEVAGAIATQLATWVAELPDDESASRCDLLAGWLKHSPLSPGLRYELLMMLHENRHEPQRIAAWCGLWEEWKTGPDSNDAGVEEVFARRQRSGVGTRHVLTDTIHQAGIKLSDAERLILLDASPVAASRRAGYRLQWPAEPNWMARMVAAGTAQ